MPVIAPHEGNELDMLLAGTKVFAVLDTTKHGELIRQFLNNRFDYNTISYMRYNNGEEFLLYTIAGFNNYMLYKTLVKTRVWYIELFGKEDYQRKMGKIFGYSDEEIQSFIDNPPKCTCDKCGG